MDIEKGAMCPFFAGMPKDRFEFSKGCAFYNSRQSKINFKSRSTIRGLL